MLWLLTITLLVSAAHGWVPGSQQDPKASPQRDVNNLQFGDMKFTHKQLKHINKGIDAGVSDHSFAASSKAFHRWPDAIIPYEIDCSLENMPSVLKAIRLAQGEWMSKTCIKFVKRTNEKDYLRFFRGTNCWGNVGKIGGASQISVGIGCDYQHVMVHEIGHVVGFWHEQNRMDRDDWVEIFWDNIDEPTKYNFKKVVDTDSLGVHYDYASIMHYPWYAFSKNGKDTMRPKKHVDIQPYQHLSVLDAKQTSLMYNCPAILKKRENERNAKLMFAASGCTDQNPNCKGWAKAGYCNSNDQVAKICKKSCKDPNCDVTIPCVDKDPRCPKWLSWGHCKYISVAKTCVLSCADRCKTSTPAPPPTLPPTQPPTRPPTQPPSRPPTQGPLPTSTPSKEVKLGIGKLCRDYHSKCEEWASIGECTNNPGWMLANCKISCKQTDCDLGIQKPAGSCAEPLGLAYDGKNFKLPDSAFSAASEFTPGDWVAAAMNARLYFEDDYDNKRIGAWCVKTWADFLNGPYIQIDLQQTKTIQYIATQGRDKYFERVSKYKISHSNNGADFTFYQEDGKDKVFLGNCDHFTPILNRFKNKINARYLRYYPTEANFPCVRMELYGC